jgi:phosphomecalonate degydratase small subunit
VKGRGIVGGRAAGPALVSAEPISFLGDLDIRSGEIVGALPSVRGRKVGGTVLLFPASMGSAGAWRFLYQLYVHGTHPVALVSAELPDPSVVQGAMLAGIPVVAEVPLEALLAVPDGALLQVDGDAGEVLVSTPAPG